MPVQYAVRRRGSLIFCLGALEGLVFGYDNGVIAGALLFVRQEMGLSPGLQGLVVSSLMTGALVGAPLSGRLSERLGSPRLIATAGLLFLLGSLGSAAAHSPATLIACRFVLGVGIGVGTVQVPTYLAELSPARSRGALASLYQLMIATGLLLAYVVNYAFAGAANWRGMIAAGALPAALLMAGTIVLPNSPRWLVKRGRIEEARAVLAATRPADEAVAELADIQRLASTTKLSVRALLGDRWLKRVLLLSLALAVFQQALGINTIVYYTPTILQSAGFTTSMAILTSGLLQGLSVLMVVVVGRIVDRVGRRMLLMGGALAMAASMAALGVLFAGGLLNSGAGAGLAVGCLALFKAAFSLTWGPVVWITMPELLPLRARPTAMGLCVFATFAANVVISTAFPTLLASGPTVAFGTFALAGVAAFVFTARLLPETAGRTLEQIEAAGRGRSLA